MPSICKTFISNKLIFYIMFLYIVYHKVVCSYDMSSHGFLRYHCCHVTMFYLIETKEERLTVRLSVCQFVC